MKTTKIKLFAMMVTLAAVLIATTIPANAQRRSSERNTESKARSSDSRVKSAVKKQSTFKHQDSRREPTRKNTTVRRGNSTKSATVQRPTRSTRSGSPIASSSRPNHSARRSTSTQTTRTYSSSNSIPTKSGERTQGVTSRSKPSTSTSSRHATSVSGRRTTGYNSSVKNRPSSVTTKSATRVSPDNKHKIYRHNTNDRRYTTNKNYRGSQKSWSHSLNRNYVPYKNHSHNYYKHYDYRTYRHWDRRWENYRWNYKSWRDYYWGYHPHSYKFHKHYYHHHLFGHVIQHFDFPPYVFMHHHKNYYCYNGHFFKYRRGIGYILVDMPYGFEFEILPQGYERVYINGYLYFRIGNLFFEFTGNGFRLVHYPERYYTYNDGYYFEDDYY